MTHLLNNDDEIKPINTISLMDEIKTTDTTNIEDDKINTDSLLNEIKTTDVTNIEDDKIKQLENRLTELEKTLYCMIREIVDKLDEHAKEEELMTRTETEKNII